jgi:hypothetical protein
MGGFPKIEMRPKAGEPALPASGRICGHPVDHATITI